jgi:hypothetical protein
MDELDVITFVTSFIIIIIPIIIITELLLLLLLHYVVTGILDVGMDFNKKSNPIPVTSRGDL